MERRTMVIVDDEAIILLSIKQELKNYFGDRFHYETALDASEAMEIIEDSYDSGNITQIVISDWLMPGMKGDEFLRIVNEKHPEIKNILVTGQADADTIEYARNTAGVRACLTKPWSNNLLINTVRDLLADEI